MSCGSIDYLEKAPSIDFRINHKQPPIKLQQISTNLHEALETIDKEQIRIGQIFDDEFLGRLSRDLMKLIRHWCVQFVQNILDSVLRSILVLLFNGIDENIHEIRPRSIKFVDNLDCGVVRRLRSCPIGDLLETPRGRGACHSKN